MNADRVIFPIHKELAFEQCTFNKTHFSTFTKCLEMNADREIFPVHRELTFQCIFNKTHFSIVTKCLQMNTHRVICKFIKNCRFNVISIKLILVFLQNV